MSVHLCAEVWPTKCILHIKPLAIWSNSLILAHCLIIAQTDLEYTFFKVSEISDQHTRQYYFEEYFIKLRYLILTESNYSLASSQQMGMYTIGTAFPQERKNKNANRHKAVWFFKKNLSPSLNFDFYSFLTLH